KNDLNKIKKRYLLLPKQKNRYRLFDSAYYRERMIHLVERSVKVELETGLQARPAALFVQEANKYGAHIFLEKDGKRINAKSIMGLMSLAITSGETIKLVADGTDADTAIDQLASFVTQA